jgi:Asp-tRNA(Asn)/Glu-tRNA(Gln) amidotransferase A subunit family amidase
MIKTPDARKQAGAVELARMIASRDISSAEAVETHIARIEEVNPKLNAVVWPLFERARTDAAQVDKAGKGAVRHGALSGVPITVKDQFEVEGAPSTWGLPSRAAELAKADGPLVKRLR